MRKLFFISFLFLLAASFSQLRAQNENDPLPLNPKVTTGHLPNGITYYILPNKKPEKKVELRLILNSGSLSEEDDQQGLAHMAEHMAFNGTTNFKKNDIVSFLQDIGVGFGSDLNAYTSFDRTVYILPIPTDNPGNLEKGFQVLEDWAHNVTYLTADIEGERAIILEESRLGKGADDRMERKWLPVYLNGSRYASRLPIGKDEIIKTFNPDRIRDYYKTWYRPDLMAVAVTGDITSDEALALIKKHFESILPVLGAPKLPAFDFPAYQKDVAAINTDKEGTGYSLDINWSAYPEKPLTTFGDFKKSLEKSLFTSMLNSRLREVALKPNPPFIYAGASFGSWVRGYDQFSISAGTGNENPAKAVDALVAEMERVKQFGFTEPELARAKKSLQSFYENAYNNRDKTQSSQLINEFIDLYLEGNASPGIENEFNYVKTMMPAISLASVNAIANQFKGDQKKFINITGPENAAVKLPTPEELISSVEKASKQNVTPYEEKAIATELLSKQPKPGKVVSKKKNTATTATDLVLSNGITVSLKPTDFKDDEIVMQAQRLGGISNYGIKDYYSAKYAGAIQGAQGYGSFSPTDLQKALSGKKISAGGLMGETRDEYRGSSTVKDLETMFQLLYLKVTEPRKDTALISSFIKKQKAAMAMAMANPQTAFIDTLGKFIYNGSIMAPLSVPKPEDFDKINAERAAAIFKERMGDATGMHFVFTGSFKEAEIIPLLEKYIASLPVSGKKITFKDNKLRPKSGNHTFVFNKGKEEKSLVLEFYNGTIPYSEDMNLKAQAMAEALNIRIIEELREKAQAIYGGGINGGLEKEPYPSYQFIAYFPSGPTKIDTLLTGMQILVSEIQKKGPSVEVLEKVKKQWLEQHREELTDNNAWAEALMSNKVDKENFSRFLNYENFVKKITPKDVQLVAQKLLTNKNKIVAIQMPEKKEEQGKKPF